MAGRQEGFYWSADAVFKNLDKLDKVMPRVIVAAVEYHASRGEARMRKAASWTDRTGNARNGLHTATHHTDSRSEITFAHGVPYGIWLEVRFAGRYAVILSSVNAEGDALMNTLNKSMAKIQ